MKNLVSPEVLESFMVAPIPIKEIVEFLDGRPEISTHYLCKLIGIPPRKIYDHRSNKKRRCNINDTKDSQNTVLPKVASKK
ncbi:MAG: hypothetical protein HQK51_19000, partial [Oligoflexia bacterium]|nr:hypothetical protein [Oligoflexia bacterium]